MAATGTGRITARSLLAAAFDLVAFAANAALAWAAAVAAGAAWKWGWVAVERSHVPLVADRAALTAWATSPDRLGDAHWVAAAWVLFCLCGGAAWIAALGARSLAVRVRARLA